MSAHPRVRNASWMSSRISQRMRRRRNQCRWAKARSTTQRWAPRPEPCSVVLIDSGRTKTGRYLEMTRTVAPTLPPHEQTRAF